MCFYVLVYGLAAGRHRGRHAHRLGECLYLCGIAHLCVCVFACM